MPIITSSEKDLRRTAKRTARNRAALGKLRSSLKRARTAIAAGQAEPAKEALVATLPILDRAPSKGIMHKNAVARHKSRLMRRLNALAASPGS